MDEFVNSTLGPAINDLESEILTSEKNIAEYRELLNEKNKNNRTKASIENTISKKEKEKEILNDILSGYKEELLAKISTTNILNGIKNNLEVDIKNNEIELLNLEKVSMLDFKTKDVIEEENDKEKLRVLNEEIKAIKNRQKYDKTPDEIYDQIEMYLANMSATSPKLEKNNRNYEMDSLLLNSEETTKSENASSAATKEVFNETIIKDEISNTEPLVETVSKNNRLKVVEMIPVETIKKDSVAGVGEN